MEKGKLQKRESKIKNHKHKCPFCEKTIAKHLIPENDMVKPKGIAYYKRELVHSCCYREFFGHNEYQERNINIANCRKLENTGLGGDFI